MKVIGIKDSNTYICEVTHSELESKLYAMVAFERAADVVHQFSMMVVNRANSD